MQTAAALLDALHSLGQKGIPLQRVYRLLYNSQLLAMGLDATAQREIPGLIQALRQQRFRWGRNQRQDFIASRGVSLILSAYAAAQDAPYVHGLRADTGIHSALKASKFALKHARWLWSLRLIPHATNPSAQTASLLANWVADGRFRELAARYFKAYPQPEPASHAALSQTLSPDSLYGLLCHLALRRLDAYLTETASRTPAGHLRFVRHMNGLLVAWTGDAEKTEQFKREIKAVLHGQGLGIGSESSAKRLHATQEATYCEFLGYEMAISPHAATLRMPRQRLTQIHRAYMARGKPISRGERVALPDSAICALYAQEFGAVDQYYALAENRHLLRGVQRTMRSSLLRTLAHKHKCRVSDATRYLSRVRAAEDHALLDNIGKTQFQVKWIDDVQWRDPRQTPAGEPCAVKVARTVRREA